MKRFAFPLETARVWRFRQLETEEGRLQQLFAERESLLDGMETLAAELRSEETLLTNSRLQSEQLALLDAFRRHVVDRKKQLLAAVVACEQRIEAQRQRLLEARRRFELLNRLREKALVQWQADRAQEDEQLAADLYLARCARER